MIREKASSTLGSPDQPDASPPEGNEDVLTLDEWKSVFLLDNMTETWIAALWAVKQAGSGGVVVKNLDPREPIRLGGERYPLHAFAEHDFAAVNDRLKSAHLPFALVALDEEKEWSARRLIMERLAIEEDPRNVVL